MEKLTEKLIQEIQNVSKIIKEYQEYEDEFRKYKYTENDFDSKHKLKKQETYFEKLYESYISFEK